MLNGTSTALFPHELGPDCVEPACEVPISEFLLTLVTLSIIESGLILMRSKASRRIGEYSTMVATPSRPCANEIKPAPFTRDARSVDVEELLAENDRLRNLVVQLSKLVIKNVADTR